MKLLIKGDRPAKEHFLFHGLHIEIENPVGSQRHWHDGTESGTTTMKLPYGRIKDTEGLDGDGVDCFVGKNPHSKKVFIVTQLKAPTFKEVDEQKVMLGFDDEESAKKAYLAHYNDPRFFGGIVKMKIKKFKKKLAKKKFEGEFIKHEQPRGLTLSGLAEIARDLRKAAGPPGAGWEAIPHGHHGGYRRKKGHSYEYWYPRASHAAPHRNDGGEKKPEPEEKRWTKPATFTEDEFKSGAFDKDPTHWHWKLTDGEMKAWVVGGVNTASQHPVKTGGRFGKLWQLFAAEDPSHPGFAILKDVQTGERMMMQHSRIFPVEHDPMRRARVKEPPKEEQPAWVPEGGKKPTISSGAASSGAAKRAPKFDGSLASQEKQPGLYAIENGVYPMMSVTRWETDDDGKKRQVRREVIGVPDLGKTLLVKEFEPLIASTAKRIAKGYGLKAQFERGLSGHSQNITVHELQRAGVEGVLDAIEHYKADDAFAPHAKQFVLDHIRFAAARERLGGVTLPPKHMRNVARFIAARAQAAKALGIDDPTAEQVLPFFKLLKRHIHSNLATKQGAEEVPLIGYKLHAVGEEGGEPIVVRDTKAHPGKGEWAALYHSFLQGQATAHEMLDEDKFALPGVAIGAGYSPEDRIGIRHAVSNALDAIAKYEYTTEGRKKITYRGDAGKMIALRLGLIGDDELSVRQIAQKVPIHVVAKDGTTKRLEQRQAENVVAEMIERALPQVRDAVKDRDARGLIRRAEEKLVPPVTVPPGPTWHEQVRTKAKSVTPMQIAQFREDEAARLTSLAERSRSRASEAKGSSKYVHEMAADAAAEALRRLSRMDEKEVRLRIAQQTSPTTPAMRRLMLHTVTVDVPPPRGHEFGHAMISLTNLATGAESSVRVRTLRDLRHPEDRAIEKSDRAQADATLTSGMVYEAIHYPRTMRLLVAPDESVSYAPTLARRTLEILSGLGGG